MGLLTENTPTSGKGSANCKTCNWTKLNESTEQCSNCKQTRPITKKSLQENQGGSKLLLENQ